MTEKNEALRLARELEACPSINYKAHAAELRRQHGEIKSMQVERLQTERRLAAYEPMLEALRHIANHDLSGADLIICGHIAHALVGKARDAIKAIEEEKE